MSLLRSFQRKNKFRFYKQDAPTGLAPGPGVRDTLSGVQRLSRDIRR